MLTSENVRSSFKYLFPAELPALKILALQLPPNPLIVNIGAGSGTSGLAFMESRPDVILVTIDIENQDSPLGSLYSEQQVFGQAGFAHLYASRWHQIHGDSKKVGRAWANMRLDVEYFGASFYPRKPNMVFIDGDHSYEGCKGDIEAWLPLIVPGGILAVHDFLKGDLQPDPDGPHPKNWPGVDSAVHELLIPNFEMILHVASLIAFKV